MEPEFDLRSSADTLAEVVAEAPDDRLDAATPCADTDVGSLLTHIVGFTEAFRQTATKESVGKGHVPQIRPGDRPPSDWRSLIPEQLDALVEAWRVPTAWDGDSEAAGAMMPAPVLARVALDELVIHAWDLARGIGTRPRTATADLEILRAFLSDNPFDGAPGLFGPAVQVPSDAPLLHRVLGDTGRDPFWPA